MRTQALLAFFVTALLASCGGGGPGSTTTTPLPADDNYDQTVFGYTDPNPVAFHPLGRKTSSLMQLDEAMVFFNRTASFADAAAALPGILQLREDTQQDSAQVPISTGSMAQGGFIPLDACTGDLDGDGVLEAIFTGLVPSSGGNYMGIRVSKPDLSASSTDYSPAATEEYSYNAWATGVIAVHCAAGDLDADGTDELILMESFADRTTLHVIKQFDDGGLPVFGDVSGDVFSSITFIGPIGRVAVGQFDGDDALELVVSHGTPGGKGVPASLITDLYDDLNSGMAFLEQIANYTGFDTAIEIAVGEFDGDPLDEITLGLQTWLSTEFIFNGAYENYRTWTNAYDWEPGQGSSLIRATAHDTYNPPNWEWDAIGQRRRERFVAADLNEDGIDEVCWLHVTLSNAYVPFNSSTLQFEWYFGLRTWQPVSGSTTLTDLSAGGPYNGGDLAVVDDDGSGDDDILATFSMPETVGNLPDGTYAYARQALISSPGNATFAGYIASNSNAVPIMAGGDFDGEGMRVSYTGVKYQYLPDPIPIVLLAAPPTKDGIGQNTPLTGSSYSVSDSATEAYTVNTSTSISLTLGFGIEALAGNYEASLKGTVKASVDKSTGRSSTLTTSQVFSGAYDANSIVFEGTLHTLYEYEVVSAVDPAAVGTTVSINVPVATKVFKWTTDYYNQNVDAKNQIPADVFPQTIGDPATYPTRESLLNLLASREGWEGRGERGTNGVTVGQGSGFNSIKLSLANVLSEGQAYAYGVEVSTEFKIGSAIFGSSVGVSNSYLYEVSVARETTYEGAIGDIAAADWADWQYEAGMVVYTRAEAGKKPFQVLQYWTNPLGNGY
ncbi:MAG TPA: hypothetical protein ENK04_09330 [Gammaproteobacteria bacterium]|nr:hypothetical protein [Gammaproteobacteria bacterium]